MGSKSPWQRRMEQIKSAPPAEIVRKVVTDPTALARRDAAAAALRKVRDETLAAVFMADGVPSTVAEREKAERKAYSRKAVKDAQAALAAAEEALADSTVHMLFRSLPSDAYEALQQRFIGEDGTLRRTTAFDLAIVAASHVHVEPGEPDADGDPTWIEYEGMTEEDAAALLPSLQAGDRLALIESAIAVNHQSRIGFADLGKGSRLTPA